MLGKCTQGPLAPGPELYSERDSAALISTSSVLVLIQFFTGYSCCRDMQVDLNSSLDCVSAVLRRHQSCCFDMTRQFLHSHGFFFLESEL